ncbi:protein MULTIPOLAR SPINDLE 1 isoform X1 [Malania oleifera]|uniref:protein MULTIPOLAR SPINDLE 1 isoform X1 n=1 Tax=Malania oleifera TaxID=397392 RepID=UPI0025AE388A|nr:protein MULTIPOLAR SPINDLE 1 isoform X1 [Malania oleifera]
MSSEKDDSNAALKLATAIAMAMLRPKLLPKRANSSSSLSSAAPTAARAEPDALRWKQKAKERKKEILRLKEYLKEAEDGLQNDMFPQAASCKCYFFDTRGKSSADQLGDGSEHRFSDVLRRRFLRQVRFKERKRRRTNGSTWRWHSDFNIEDETEQLRASVDFLVELCNTVSPVEEASFANWSHQAVDFILASLKNLLPMGKDREATEVIVNSLIMRLVGRMCAPLRGDELHQTDVDHQFYVQHLIRKLGSEPYLGQRALLSISHRISALAESLLFLDPFDDAFPEMHNSMFIMIQLVEFLVSDYLLAWSKDEGFDNMLFEEWATSLLHAKKALELLESRNGLYVLYMDRVTGELAKQAAMVSSLQNLNPHILDNLLR